jgi:hypothetical protein
MTMTTAAIEGSTRDARHFQSGTPDLMSVFTAAINTQRADPEFADASRPASTERTLMGAEELIAWLGSMNGLDRDAVEKAEDWGESD